MRNELSIKYQPIVDLAAGESRAVEALLRWTLGSGRDVPPATFIPIAEETGEIDARWAPGCSGMRPHRSRSGTGLPVQVERLGELGCTMIQGYFFTEPGPLTAELFAFEHHLRA